MSTKDDVSAGGLFAGFFATFILLIAVLYPPVSHYAGKWSDYWNPKTEYSASVPVSSTIRESLNLESAAYKDCRQRAVKFLSLPLIQIISYASSTSEISYKTYDCYTLAAAKIQ